MNNLPKAWAVYNDGSELFKQHVIQAINKLDQRAYFNGNSVGLWYFWDGNKADCCHIEGLHTYVQRLSLQEFIEMSPSYLYKEGEWVEVSEDNIKWQKRIFLTKIKSNVFCVALGSEAFYENDKPICPVRWKYIRPIQKEPIIIKLGESGHSVVVEKDIKFGCSRQYSIGIDVIESIIKAYKQYNDEKGEDCKNK